MSNIVKMDKRMNASKRKLLIPDRSKLMRSCVPLK